MKMTDKETNMNAIEYLKERAKICKLGSCTDCPISSRNNHTGLGCDKFEHEHPAKAVAIVEKWAKEHAVKTRQDIFLEQYPKATIDMNGIMRIYPCYLGETCDSDTSQNCNACRKTYWSEPVEEKK